jgi:hypothetical protein
MSLNGAIEHLMLLDFMRWCLTPITVEALLESVAASEPSTYANGFKVIDLIHRTYSAIGQKGPGVSRIRQELDQREEQAFRVVGF